MEFELHLLEPVGYVFVVYPFYVDGPGVCVIGMDVGGPVGGFDGFGFRSVDWEERLVVAFMQRLDDLPNGRWT